MALSQIMLLKVGVAFNLYQLLKQNVNEKYNTWYFIRTFLQGKVIPIWQ